jgi:hypothetical protein
MGMEVDDVVWYAAIALGCCCSYQLML